MLYSYFSNISHSICTRNISLFLLARWLSSFQGIGSLWHLVWVETYEGQRIHALHVLSQGFLWTLANKGHKCYRSWFNGDEDSSSLVLLLGITVTNMILESSRVWPFFKFTILFTTRAVILGRVRRYLTHH